MRCTHPPTTHPPAAAAAAPPRRAPSELCDLSAVAFRPSPDPLEPLVASSLCGRASNSLSQQKTASRETSRCLTAFFANSNVWKITKYALLPLHRAKRLCYRSPRVPRSVSRGFESSERSLCPFIVITRHRPAEQDESSPASHARLALRSRHGLSDVTLSSFCRFAFHSGTDRSLAKAKLLGCSSTRSLAETEGRELHCPRLDAGTTYRQAAAAATGQSQPGDVSRLVSPHTFSCLSRPPLGQSPTTFGTSS